MATDQQPIIDELARRYDVSAAAVQSVVRAMRSGGGSAAQFNHPDLGGMGQWQGGGMVMIGDMFNNGLKDRVARLCQDVSAHVRDGNLPDEGSGKAGDDSASAPSRAGGGDWWPEGLGRPSSSGAQNAMRYAFFPDARRLAIEQHGKVSVYDTGEHRLSGFSQSQSTSQSLAFSSADGPVRLDSLRRLES